MRAKRSEGAEAVLVERKEADSACIYENLRQRIKSLEMVGMSSFENNLFLFVCPEYISKVDPTRPDHDALYQLTVL